MPLFILSTTAPEGAISVSSTSTSPPEGQLAHLSSQVAISSRKSPIRSFHTPLQLQTAMHSRPWALRCLTSCPSLSGGDRREPLLSYTRTMPPARAMAQKHSETQTFTAQQGRMSVQESCPPRRHSTLRSFEMRTETRTPAPGEQNAESSSLCAAVFPKRLPPRRRARHLMNGFVRKSASSSKLSRPSSFPRASLAGGLPSGSGAAPRCLCAAPMRSPSCKPASSPGAFVSSTSSWLGEAAGCASQPFA
mmetsp:Transcript_17872/g.42897  ORF Transcript_17872/g.42897 Transcript_17872/m.42897 type:complete len:249 (-) Transcript_17872:688-1434(-)